MTINALARQSSVEKSKAGINFLIAYPPPATFMLKLAHYFCTNGAHFAWHQQRPFILILHIYYSTSLLACQVKFYRDRLLNAFGD